MKVRFSYVQFRSPPNTSWKATYKLFPIFGPKRKKKAMCNLNIPQTSFQRWYVVGEVQILLSGKKYSVILTSPIILLTLAAFFGSRTSLTVLTLTSGVPIRRAHHHTIRNVMGAILFSRTSQWWSTFCYSQAHNLDWIWVVCIRGIHYVCQMCCSEVNIAKNILSWVANQSAPSTLSTFLLHTNRCSWQASYFRRNFVITRNTRTA